MADEKEYVVRTVAKAPFHRPASRSCVASAAAVARPTPHRMSVTITDAGRCVRLALAVSESD